MGWDRKDAVGESFLEGDRVKVFRNFSGDEDCAKVVGRVGVIREIEVPHYIGRLHVKVRFPNGLDVWMHHMSVMIV